MYDVLIVEDEQHIRLGLKKHTPWRDFGFRVIADADSGEEALRVFADRKPHVILTDIHMSKMSGLELMQSVRALCPLTKFVVLSGFNEFEYARQSMNCGASAYLLKPFKSMELREAFRKVKLELDANMQGKDQRLWYRSMPVAPSSSINQLLIYIDNHYDQKVTLNEMADKASMSPAHFSKYFKKHVGHSFIEYLTEMRLNKAKDYLVHTDFKVIEIAMMIGYEDFRHFCKLFKSREGISPMQYRHGERRSG